MRVILNNSVYEVTRVHTDSCGNKYIGVKLYSHLDPESRLYAKNLGFFQNMKRKVGSLFNGTNKRLTSIKKVTQNNVAQRASKLSKVNDKISKAKSPALKQQLMQKKTDLMTKNTNAYKSGFMKSRTTTNKVAQGAVNTGKFATNTLIGKKRIDAFKANPNLKTTANLGWGAVKRVGGTALVAGTAAAAGTAYLGTKAIKGAARAGGNAARSTANAVRPIAQNLNRPPQNPYYE